ncbi:hypothetical protein C1646_763281 [Rhizophagus diaphanus]|nr:hypothetical protein C1646_763281 [Rhizophagus diaphanus] [Rhizophagus sp. MUCL 43196]
MKHQMKSGITLNIPDIVLATLKLKKKQDSIVNVNPINLTLAKHGITSNKLKKIGADHVSRIYRGRNDSYCQYLQKLACRQVVGHHESEESCGVMNDPPSCNCLKASLKNQKLAQLLGLNEQNAEVYSVLSGEIGAKETIGRLSFQICKEGQLLEVEVEDLNEYVVVDLIHEIVPSLIGKKGKKGCKSSSYSFDSSEESDLIETVREKKDVPHKQQRKARPRTVKRVLYKMAFVDCVVEENISLNCIGQKHIGELGFTYHDKRKTLFDLIITCNHAGSQSYNTAIGQVCIVPAITEEDVKCLGIKIDQISPEQ